MGLPEELRKRREARGWSQRDVAERLNPQMTSQIVSKWESGKSVPRMPVLQQLSKLFSVSVADLLGEGAPLVGRSAHIPLVAGAHMGEWDSEEADAMVEVPATVAENHPNGKAVRGFGPCMNRELPEDAVLVVDPDMRPRNGSIVLAERDGQLIVRRFMMGADTLLLSPDSYSEKYDDIVVTPEDEPVRIVGVVVWYQRREDVRYG